MSQKISESRGAICVAVYRPAASLLRRQLDSISAQQFRAWECHVGIDGRDADTLALVRSIVGADGRFVIHEFDENVGFYRNFERTVAAATATTGGWVALADQDDYWYPDKLQNLVRLIEEPGITAVIGRARVVDADGHEFGVMARREASLVDLLLNNQVTGSSTIFRRSVVDMALPFPEPTDAAYHDHWLGVIARAMGAVVVSDDLVQDYVQHAGNVLGEERHGRMMRRLRTLRTNSAGLRHMLRYLATQRWGWRVRMASELVARGMGTDVADVQAIARGPASIRVFMAIGGAIWRGTLPLARGIALLVGAIAWLLCRFDMEGQACRVVSARAERPRVEHVC